MTSHNQYMQLDNLNVEYLFVNITSSKQFVANMYGELEGDILHIVDKKIGGKDFLRNSSLDKYMR